MDNKPLKTNTNVVLTCPYCKSKTINHITLICIVEENDLYISGCFMAECNQCNKPTLYLEKDKEQYDHQVVGYSPNVVPSYSLGKKLLNRKMLYPRWTANDDISFPAENMPEDIKREYEEAVSVFDCSPRAAGVLIRVTLEDFLKKYVYKKSNKNLNNMIGILTNKQPEYVTHMLDVIRTTANGQAHSNDMKSQTHLSEIRLLNDNDTAEDVKSLFIFLNLICESWKIIQVSDKMFDNLPSEKKNQIEKRNDKYKNKE